MSPPEPGLRYDASERRHDRLIPEPSGDVGDTLMLINELNFHIHDLSRGIACGRHLPASRPSSNFPPPRSFSRGNQGFLPQSPSVTQATSLGQFPRQLQTTSPQQASRGLPQPTHQYGTQRPPVQGNQAVSQARNTQSLSYEVARLGLSDTRPNPTPYRSQQTPLTPHTSGYHAGPVNLGAETRLHPRGELTVLGPNHQNPYPYSNSYVGPPPSHATHSQRSPFQPIYTAQNAGNYPATSRPHTLSPGYNPATGPVSNLNIPSLYPQPNPRPNATQPSVSPVMTMANQTATSGSQAGQGPPREGQYRKDLSNYEGESVDDDVSAVLVRGTEGLEERLDPSFRVVNKHWQFFVEGRVFIMLSWESVGHGNTAGNSIQKFSMRSSKHGEEAFAKVYRYVVVRPRPKQGYSMCLRISTHGGQGAVGKLINQQEHGIVYMGDTPPQKLAEEKNLHKDPIRVMPADTSQNLHPLSRIHYAKPYPVEHNVKVREVGMVAPRDRRKLMGYYKLESGYETEREPERRHERRPRRESESSTNTAPDKRLQTEPEATGNKETERKPRREPIKDNRRRR